MHETVRRKFAVARTVEEIFPLVENWRDGTSEKQWFQTR
jgi:hypothetical protein